MSASRAPRPKTLLAVSTELASSTAWRTRISTSSPGTVKNIPTTQDLRGCGLLGRVVDLGADQTHDARCQQRLGEGEEHLHPHVGPRRQWC